MKKTISILILLILIPTLCFAGALQEKQRQVIAKKNVAAPSGDSCTGALLLSAHFENSDTVTSGTPAGCNSNDDQTWALTGTGVVYSSTQASDGTYALYIPDGNAVKHATIGADWISASGTLIFDIYVITKESSALIASFNIDANNRIDVYFTSTTNQIGTHYKGNGTSVSLDSAAELTVNGWHTVTVKWSVAGVGGKTQSIQIDSNSAVTGDNALTDLVGTPGGFYFGDSVGGASAQNFYIDKVKVYNTWQ